MNLLREIALQTIEILTLVFGMLGMGFALMLIFAPAAARHLSRLLNRSVDVDRRLGALDKSIPTDAAIYGHPVMVGGGLAAGSLFALAFFLCRFDAATFARVFFGAHHQAFYGEIVFEAVAWIGKIGSLAGLLTGIGLITAPRRLQAIDRKMNVSYETRPWIEKLQRPALGLDDIFFRYPVVSGLLLGSASSVLIAISVLNLLR